MGSYVRANFCADSSRLCEAWSGELDSCPLFFNEFEEWLSVRERKTTMETLVLDHRCGSLDCIEA